ncbi:uncharacterized protein MONBRDRAFT_26245 [Monosiga brevicollis MX1]|uniref:Tr-type G domain-containing protein n=1 Tax=Monosiga brevicollis TaxID=81824 RepID=A9V1T3_MONBE|nr:uncharacterized protein MONBRDRAFT_26245 [Monosiga brevicollis MX1]EDQ88618.1 predicted protein [Monosiga brevicollis MX1]|eukprot:XP_001746722.1 hypothetical protein [Monosiga brevicollis MX1]
MGAGRSVKTMMMSTPEGNTEYKLKLVNVTSQRLTHLITQMRWRLAEGDGECVYQIGVADDGTVQGLQEHDLAASLETLALMAEKAGAHITTIHSRLSFDGSGMVAEVHLRRVREEQHFLDVRLALVGDSGVGKSTLIGVLGSGILETELGAARLNIFRHNHEMLTGRTSCLNTEIIGFDEHGRLVNHDDAGTVATLAQICQRATKLVHLRDSPGHIKYEKTAMRALADPSLDYVVLVVAANHGMTPRAKEHLAVACALECRMIVLVTKIDQSSKVQLKATLTEIATAIKAPTCKRVPFLIRNRDDVMSAARNGDTRNIIPILLLSCVTGQNLDHLKHMLNMLPTDSGKRHARQRLADPLCHVQETFDVPDTGLVVGGPDDSGCFAPVTVTDVQRHRTPVKAVEDQVSVCTSFEASLMLTKAEASLTEGTEVCVYLGSVRQHCRLTQLHGPLEHEEDTTTATLTWPGARFVFQNQVCRGLGTVCTNQLGSGPQSDQEPLDEQEDESENEADRTPHLTV